MNYCDQRVCMSVSLLAYLNNMSRLHEIFITCYTFTVADDNGIFPFLQMTSCFHMIWHMWCMARLTAEGC